MNPFPCFRDFHCCLLTRFFTSCVALINFLLRQLFTRPLFIIIPVIECIPASCVNTSQTSPVYVLLLIHGSFFSCGAELFVFDWNWLVLHMIAMYTVQSLPMTHSHAHTCTYPKLGAWKWILSLLLPVHGRIFWNGLVQGATHPPHHDPILAGHRPEMSGFGRRPQHPGVTRSASWLCDLVQFRHAALHLRCQRLRHSARIAFAIRPRGNIDHRNRCRIPLSLSMRVVASVLLSFMFHSSYSACLLGCLYCFSLIPLSSLFPELSVWCGPIDHLLGHVFCLFFLHLILHYNLDHSANPWRSYHSASRLLEV